MLLWSTLAMNSPNVVSVVRPDWLLGVNTCHSTNASSMMHNQTSIVFAAELEFTNLPALGVPCRTFALSSCSHFCRKADCPAFQHKGDYENAPGALPAHTLSID